jgi:GxxExxY protein
MRERVEPDAALDNLAKQVIGACIEVHRQLGPGYLESTYGKALAIELRERDVPFEKEAMVRLQYKSHEVGEGRLDFLIGGRLVVELKAVDSLADIHTAQVLAYLKATGHQLGLLINFNQTKLIDGLKRVVLSA